MIILTSTTNGLEPKNYEKIYLIDIHDSLEQDSLLDLHTYFWSKNFLTCPICQLRLFWKPDDKRRQR